MARFDRHSGHIVVRIVYDGAATAGKTTNLEQLTRLLTRSRRGELVVPETSRGRTLFFDWLQLQGGLIAGHRFHCELLTVPGQEVLRSRRSHILRTADVVVMVVDSRPEGVADARSILARMPEDVGREAPVPLVLQANKQDMPGALEPEEVARRLELDPSTPLVGALASEGMGVRDTALLAMRQAAMTVQTEVLRTGVALLPPTEDTPESLHASMKTLHIGDVAALDPVPASDVSRSGPHWPSGDVPSTHIWPAAIGRDVIRGLSLEASEPAPETIHGKGRSDKSAVPSMLVYRSGDFSLKTSQQRSYLSVDEAEAALVDLARAKVTLGGLLMPQTVLVLQPDADERLWLWTICPRATSLQEEMVAAEAAGSSAALRSALVDFARTSFEAVALLREKQLVLELEPENFARHDDGIGYTHDGIARGTQNEALGASWLRRVDEYASAYDAVEQYISEIESRIPEAISANDAAAWGLVEVLNRTPVASDAGREAKRRLAGATRRCR